jgi:creatinine amidohydrolase
MQSYEQPADRIERYGNRAIVPVGSLEQHGPHLPVNTDVAITQAYADRLGERLDAFVLPCLPISTCREHMGKKGSVWMAPDTFYAMLKDIILSLHEQGFSRIVVVQGHGGIFVLPPLVRQLNATMNPALQVVKVELFQFAAEFLARGITESPRGLHADEIETSAMLHLRPDCVIMDKAVDFVPDTPREYLHYASLLSICPDGVWGEPSLATAEKGRRILELGAELGAAYITKLFDFIQHKKPVGYSRF